MKNESGIHPTADKVLVKEIVVERFSAGGIALPDATTDKESMAEIHATYIEAGPVALEMYELKGCTPGDIVLHAKYAGIRYRGRDGCQYRVIRAQDIFGRAEGVYDQKMKGSVPLPAGA